MSQLYTRISHGDRQTIVRKYKAGTMLTVQSDPPQTILLKVDCAAKVTQEYDAYKLAWNDIKIYLDDMVETVTDRMPKPEPTRMPIPDAYQPPPPTDMPGSLEDREAPRRPWWRFW